MNREGLKMIASGLGIDMDQLEQMHAKARQVRPAMGHADIVKHIEESVRQGRRSVEIALGPVPAGVARLVEDMQKKAGKK